MKNWFEFWKLYSCLERLFHLRSIEAFIENADLLFGGDLQLGHIGRSGLGVLFFDYGQLIIVFIHFANHSLLLLLDDFAVSLFLNVVEELLVCA